MKKEEGGRPWRGPFGPPPGGFLEEKCSELGAVFYPNIYFKNSFSPFSLLKGHAQIKKVFRDFSPDLVSCHSSFAGFLGRIAVCKNVPTIFTAHSWAFTDGASFWRKAVAIIAERFAARYTAKIICVSEFDKNLALKYKISHPFGVRNDSEI